MDTLTMKPGTYAPFGAGVAFATLVPLHPVANGYMYRSNERLGTQDNSVPAFAETFRFTTNVADPNPRDRIISRLIRIPRVVQVDGVDTVNGFAQIRTDIRVPIDASEAFRERVFHLATTGGASGTAYVAVEDAVIRDDFPS